MTVARDAILEFATFTTTSPATLSFTPVGTPRGITVAICHGTDFVDRITGVTYGGVAMQRIGSAADTVTEPGRVYYYFLGSGIPTGTQTVSITHDGSSTVKWAIVQSVTAASDTGIIQVATHALNGSDPTVIFNSGADTTLRNMILYSGLSAPSNLTQRSGMEAIAAGNGHSFGNFAALFGEQSTASSGSFTLGYTATTDDIAFVAVVIQEGRILNLAVVASADDGTDQGGAFNTNGNEITAGDSGAGSSMGAFIRFANVPIPQGATINSAKLLLVAAASAGSPVSNTDTKIRAVAADNAAAPADLSAYNALVRTTASVNFDPTDWTIGSTQPTPDISSVVQEVISRSGWVSGNALTIMWENRGSSAGYYVQAAAFDAGTFQEPRLLITYTDPIVSGGAVATINVSAAGGGIVYGEGGAVATVNVSASGGGVEYVEGGATATVEVSASGDGVEIQTEEEGSEAFIEVIAYGDGIEYAEGGSVATVEVSTSGDGTQYAEEGSSATINVTASGDGVEYTEAGSEATIEVIAYGSGEQVPLTESGSVATINVTASGDGFQLQEEEGGAVAVINVSALGGGSEVVTGGGVATINITASGAGTQHAPAMILTKGSWISYRKLN